ncbi:4Fe-4S binding protein [bacterium]|nr:4Fe-4S binding protein [bacterium]
MTDITYEKRKIPERHITRCVGCDACVRACPTRAWLDTSERPLLKPELCDGCGLCIIACPNDALFFPDVSNSRFPE